MRMFLVNLLLALTWSALTANFTFVNVLFGMLVGYVVLLVLRPVLGDSRYFGKVWQVIAFAIFFLVQIVKSNIRVAYDVLTPTYFMRPGIIGLNLEVSSDLEITVFANLISLTPGTLSLDVSNDRRVLYIHAMYIDDLEQLRAEIRDLEQRLLDVMRN